MASPRATPKKGRRKQLSRNLDSLQLISRESSSQSNLNSPRKKCKLSESDNNLDDSVDDKCNSSESRLRCSHTETIVKKLGIAGYILLLKLLLHIPKQFKSYRVKYIRDILTSVLDLRPQPDAQEVLRLIDAAEMVPWSEKELICIEPISDNILWKATTKLGQPTNLYLCPPVNNCLHCSKSLQIHHEPTIVTCYTWDGPIPAIKLTLRCKPCNLSYRYEQYGNSTDGYSYYSEPQPMVQASQVAYVDRTCCALMTSAGHHSWTSFEAMAEIYNEVMRTTKNDNAKQTSSFFDSCSAELTKDDDPDMNLKPAQLTRKTVSSSFWNYELEDELRENGLVDFKFRGAADREVAMERIDQVRAGSVYNHEECSQECVQRGCGKLFVIDGNWKLRYPICMYKVPKEVSGFDGALEYVDCCPNQPVPRMAFCANHCAIATERKIPCLLHEFIKHAGIVHDVDDDDDTSVEDGEKIELAIKGLQDKTGSSTAADCQGTINSLKSFPQLKMLDNCGEAPDTVTNCTKNIGDKNRLQKWTRGIWVCASGGGHIQMWQPLYQSEGPAQVFLLTLTWLLSAFGSQKREKWQEITLSYDNMCHLNNLKVAKKELPLPGDLKYIWQDVNKIIDSLHIKNHVDKRCKEMYNPENLKQNHPSYNTMVCEQTFTWLSRYKKILNSMPKIHHHFYLHRMVKRRNSYISFCYKNGLRPLSPSVKT